MHVSYNQDMRLGFGMMAHISVHPNCMSDPGKHISGRFSLILYCLLPFLMASCGKVPILGKITDSDTLPERLSSADMVLVGKLVSLEERAFAEREPAFGYQGQAVDRYVYYDVGKLEVREVLKGSYGEKVIYVKFLSFDQTQHPPYDKADCEPFSYHNIWDTGIWLIDIARDGEPRFTVKRGNYAPLDRLEDARECIELE